MKNQLIDRLTRYTTIDTQSDPKSTTTPSTEKQWDLLHLLEKELQQLGLPTDLDENGYLFATLESNIDVDVQQLDFWRMLIHHLISMLQMLNRKLLKTMMVSHTN